jgi:hypothetical protein
MVLRRQIRQNGTPDVLSHKKRPQRYGMAKERKYG